MRSHGRNKRPRSHREPEGDLYMQGEETHADSYSRSLTSFHLAEGYRASSNSSRMAYIPDHTVPPRSRHEEDWHHAELDHDRYVYPDIYARGERHDYGDVNSRGSEAWRAVEVPPYSQARNDWSYDAGTSSSFAENNTWPTVPPDTYDDGHGHYHERWQQKGVRDLPREDWTQDPILTDQRGDRRQHDWRQEQRREKTSSRKFQSDSGWESRKRDRRWERETPGRREDHAADKNAYAVEDRSWEPAASWKSSSITAEYQQQKGQNGQRSGQSRTKRSQHYTKQRREWRADDGDLNNWTKRDVGHSAHKNRSNQQSTKRKHPRSPTPSRSRSRSPTDSYRSLRSSRGRSRSRSFSPASKRRRRDSSLVTLRSRTPSDKELIQTYSQQDRYNSRSPSSHHSPRNAVGKKRSVSPASSMGSQRSGSRSPSGMGRSVHRLPQVNPSVTNRLQRNVKAPGNGIHHRASDVARNGKPHKQNRKDDRPRNPKTCVLPTTNDQFPNITIAMPPPPSIPSPHISRPRLTSQSNILPTPSLSEPKIDISTSRAARHSSSKNAGFKPIGLPNSSLKKFFPGDEEDMDVNTNEPPMSSVQIFDSPATEVPLLTPSREDFGWGQPRMDQQDTKVTPPYGMLEEPMRGPLLSSKRPSIHSSDASQVRGRSPLATIGHSQETSNLWEETRPISQSSTTPQSQTHIPTSPLQPENSGASSSTTSIKDIYKIISQVGEGTFGKVYKARNILSATYVALKRIRMEAEKDGFPVTAMREIKLLQSLRHDNVVRLYEMMVSNGSVYMVFEYMDHDLTGVLSQTQFVFLDAHLKSFCHQMLTGLAYLHHKGVIHRDIKGSNILINNRGELKLADFGLARFYHKRRRADYTNRVITLWYRPPELLFGATVYGPEVDMWSAGCIMLELFTKKPVFQGVDEIHQLDVIFKLLGTPTSERWADIINLPWYELVKPQFTAPNRFREAFQKWMSPAALDLAENLLEYDPTQRITARQAMVAAYFTQESPPAAKPVGLIDLEGEWHELETKRERAKRKERKPET